MKFIRLIYALLVITFIACKPNNMSDNTKIHEGAFGTCCADLKDACDSSKVPESFFYTSEEGVFYMAVGFIDTEEGPGYFDQAVIYCPFCGKKLQDPEDIQRKAGSE